MQSDAKTVAAYLSGLEPDRRSAIQSVRKVILANIDPGFQEQMQYGMIGYSVPHSTYPKGYHCDPKQPLPFAALASQKNYMSLYMCSAYNDVDFDRWIREEFEKAGKKLDMGKCCIRFKKLDDLPLDAIAKAFRRVSCSQFVQSYEQFLTDYRSTKSQTKKVAGKKAPATKVATKKSPGKKKAASAKKKGAAKRSLK